MLSYIFIHNNQATLVTLTCHGFSRLNDIMQILAGGASEGLGSGHYFQVLHNNTAPAAAMVQKESSLIIVVNESIVPSYIGLENSNNYFPLVLVHDTTTEEANFK